MTKRRAEGPWISCREAGRRLGLRNDAAIVRTLLTGGVRILQLPASTPRYSAEDVDKLVVASTEKPTLPATV